MEKKKLNPRLDYRFPQELKDEFIKVCNDQAVDPGKLIQKWMKDYIERHKKPQD